jgi:hypothetical protein
MLNSSLESRASPSMELLPWNDCRCLYHMIKISQCDEDMSTLLHPQNTTKLSFPFRPLSPFG